MRYKKGFNDISIIAYIAAILLFTAIIIPLIQAELNTSSTTFDTEGIKDDTLQDAQSISSISAFSIILNVLKLAFWDFGDSLGLHPIFDVFYTLISLVLVITIARNIWPGGGG